MIKLARLHFNTRLKTSASKDKRSIFKTSMKSVWLQLPCKSSVARLGVTRLLSIRRGCPSSS